MHIEILNSSQNDLLPVVSDFSKDFYLVGGTAIALYLGHRNSIDFDLFSFKKIKERSIKKYFKENDIEYTVLHQAYDQLHIIVQNVKIMFFQFPYEVEHKNQFENIITIPSLINLAAMKAFAFGGRAKWKDYVDMFFLLKHKLHLTQITNNAENIFGEAFNKKLFHQQLSYFNDVDYSEPVTFLSENPPTEQEIKDFLTEQALTEF